MIDPRRRIVPVVLTCDRDPPIFRIFTHSLRRVLPALSAPVVVIDTSASTELSAAYRRQVNSLRPAATHLHGPVSGASLYDSVQHAAHFALEQALAATGPQDLVLFLEDDIVFSRWFPELVRLCDPPGDAGFTTLYLPGDGYLASVIEPPWLFYGSQCLLFPRSAIGELVDGYEEMQGIPPGYDLRWSRYLADRGYRLYATGQSLVQHIGRSRMVNASHCSHRFIP